MKHKLRYFSAVLAMALGFGLTAQAQTTLPQISIAQVILQPGVTTSMEISVNPAITFSGCQFDISLPTGITLTGVEGVGEVESFTANYNALSGNLARVLLYNLTKEVTASGNIINLSLSASNNFTQPETVTINLSNIIFSTLNGGETGLADASCTINIIPVVPESLTLTPGNVNMTAGKSTECYLTLNEEATFAGIQFDFVMPKGLSVISAIGIGALETGFTIENNVITNNTNTETSTCRIVAFNTSENVNATGQILALTLQADASLTEPINSTVTVENVIYSLLNGYETPGQGGVAECIVEIPSQTLSISPESWATSIGKTQQAMVTFTPETTSDKNLTWTSDAPEVCSVNESGLMTSNSTGNAVITAIDVYGNEVSCLVSVYGPGSVTIGPGPGTSEGETENSPAENTASGGSLNGSDLTLRVGQTATILLVLSENMNAMPTMEWRLSDGGEEIVSMTPQTNTLGALFEGLQMGTTTYSVTLDGVEMTSGRITVIAEIPISSLRLDPVSIELALNSSPTKVNPIYLPEEATTTILTWTTADSNIATVSNEGLVTPVGLGETTVSATTTDGSELTAYCSVKVTAPVDKNFEFDFEDAAMGGVEGLTIYLGDTYILKPKAHEGYVIPDNIEWSSDNSVIVSVDENGRITGQDLGSATVTATAIINGEIVKVSCKVNVIPVPASSITMIFEDVVLSVGSGLSLVAIVYPPNTTYPDITWWSSDNGIVTVDDSGYITGISSGTAIIYAACGEAQGTCRVTVIPIPSQSISVSPSSITMMVGSSTTLTATITPENTTDKNIIWTSSNPGVAKVTSSGLVTAISEGEAIITARNGNQTATCVVTVISDSYPGGWGGGGTGNGTGDGDNSEGADIVVIPSEQQILVPTGRTVEMYVTTYGGYPEGWSFEWTKLKGKEVLSSESSYSFTAYNPNPGSILEVYEIRVTNSNEKGKVIYDQSFNFTVDIWGEPAFRGDNDADGDQNPDANPDNNEGTNPDDLGGYERNGIHTSALKTREGNTVEMWVEQPVGGYNDDWNYEWTINGENVGDQQNIRYVAMMDDGDTMEIKPFTPIVDFTNFGPDGNLWFEDSTFGPMVSVYRRPLTPLQLLRKGDGTSHIFIIMMPIPDSRIQDLDYNFVYGYTDAKGVSHILETTDLRYCQTTEEIYNNPGNNFWAYSLWAYSDGCTVSSGLRYLDGSSDEDFDASDFSGMGMQSISRGGNDSTAIYTIDGHYRGSDVSRLVPGIYIEHTVKDGMATAKKIIVH